MSTTRDRLNEHVKQKLGVLASVDPEAVMQEAIRFLCDALDGRVTPPKVSYKLLYEDAKAPAYQTEGASGLDLHARSVHVEPYGEVPFPYFLPPGGCAMMRSGVAFSIPKGWELQVRPRSSLSKQQVHACLGTIDSDYRGEIGVILINLGKQPLPLNKGDRVAQVVFAPVGRFELERVDQLDETKRGSQGFGSTGKQ